jgi:predicted GH43/DUF377 family glycosyl hydrolase
MTSFTMKRLGMIMEPRPGDPDEVEGVLNPAAIRGRDGQLYLFPRLVAHGNYSRIGMARVLFDASGDPIGVERMGVALEPEADYELTANGGGCEDPRISFLEPLGRYVMTYTALGRRGPRIAIAVSEDLFSWRRLGLVSFGPYKGVSFDGVDDKDASIFPLAVTGPFDRIAMAMLHRPLFPGTCPEQTVHRSGSAEPDVDRESIWISYCRMTAPNEKPHLSTFASHHRLARPVAAWEHLKIGGGAPPVLCRHGWLVVYHGVHDLPRPTASGRKMCYAAGLMVLSKDLPTRILYRSPEPVLSPEGQLECHGTVDAVTFPTGIDRRDDLGAPDRFDVYYGMADDRIGVARLDVPERLLAEPDAFPKKAHTPSPIGLE